MDTIKDHHLVVISKNECKYCKDLLDFFDAFKKQYVLLKNTEINPEELKEILETTKTKTYPIVFIDGVYVGGYNDIMTLYGN